MLLLRDLVTLTNFNISSYGWANHQTKAADTGSRDYVSLKA